VNRVNDNHQPNMEVRKVGGRQYALNMTTSLQVDGMLGLLIMSGLCGVIMLSILLMNGAPFVVLAMCIAWLTLRGRRLVKRYYFAAFAIGLIAQVLVSL
jgi:uncharacterized membrane protein